MCTLNIILMLDKKLTINLITEARLQICKQELKSNSHHTENCITIQIYQRSFINNEAQIPGNLLGFHETVNQFAAKSAFQQ